MSWPWPGVLNRARLTAHGPVALRQAALDIVEHAVRAADPYRATLDFVRLTGDRLQVGLLEFDLREWEHVYVLGAGKATQPIALALETVLGERITEGLVILKHGEPRRLGRIRILEAAHPVPDEGSLLGGQQVRRLAEKAGPRDLVLAAVTGGSSSLLIDPPAGVSLSDKQALNELLLASGASIREVNAVRKHVSRVKGGKLAEAIFPGRLINLTVSDVVGDPLDYISDPTVADTSTYQDAWATLDKYALWDRLPASIEKHLRRGPEIETPKALSGTHHNFILVSGDAACQGAVRRCEELGFAAHLATTGLEGESHVAGRKFVEDAASMMSNLQRGQAGAVIAGGETTVTLNGAAEVKGGPNQEFAFSAALEIAGQSEIVAGSIDLDGTDGPTEACGGLVDGLTVERARAAGLDPAGRLGDHATRDLLEATGDLVITGPTGTNVNDLMFILVQH